jgi:hypothetical protein
VEACFVLAVGSSPFVGGSLAADMPAGVAMEKRTVDGRIVDSHSNEFRAYCEALDLLQTKSVNEIKKYLFEIEEIRGSQAKNELKKEMQILWKHRSTLAKSLS